MEDQDAYDSHDTDSLLSNLDDDEEDESDGQSNLICKAGSAICGCCPCTRTGNNKVGASNEPEKEKEGENDLEAPDEVDEV